MPPAKPVTREDFDALVADLRAEIAAVDAHRRARFYKSPRTATPQAWKHRPWARRWIGAGEAAALTGLTAASIKLYDKQARRARREGKLTRTITGVLKRPVTLPRRLMPASVMVDGERRWMTGELALWIAAREDRQVTPESIGRKWGTPYAELAARAREINERDGAVTVKGIEEELGLGRDHSTASRVLALAGLKTCAPTQNPASDAELLTVCRELVAEHGPGYTRYEAARAVHEAGLHAAEARVGKAIMQARAEHIRAAMTPSGLDAAALESMRPDGLLTPSDVGRAFGVSPSAVSAAVGRGHLTPAKWEMVNGQARPRFDRARLALRKDGLKGPVDKGSELAADMEL